MGWTGLFSRVLTMTLAIGAASSAIAADDGIWRVGKSSGEVWMTTSGAQQASLTQEEVLKPGDTVRTGRNGRVLLVRGEETILISPNSVVGLPSEQKDGLSTTILQRAGSIMIEVEKRNVQHFQVETPYLAAVVKGTQFRVTVNGASSSVEVLRGQVQVADFKSGQIAQVMPGQHATTFAQGKPGLSLGGSGTLNPIEQGKPRASSIQQLLVPKGGLSAPRNAAKGSSTHALAQFGKAHAGSSAPATRISVSLGEVRLNFHKVTHGLAHGSNSASGSVKRAAEKDTIWGSHEGKASTTTLNPNLNDPGINSAATGMSTTTTSVMTTAAGVLSPGENDPGNGKGNGNGNGKDKGPSHDNGHDHDSGNGYGNGNGPGNGNGSGNGHGSDHGNGHHH